MDLLIINNNNNDNQTIINDNNINNIKIQLNQNINLNKMNEEEQNNIILFNEIETDTTTNIEASTLPTITTTTSPPTTTTTKHIQTIIINNPPKNELLQFNQNISNCSSGVNIMGSPTEQQQQNIENNDNTQTQYLVNNSNKNEFNFDPDPKLIKCKQQQQDVVDEFVDEEDNKKKEKELKLKDQQNDLNVLVNEEQVYELEDEDIDTFQEKQIKLIYKNKVDKKVDEEEEEILTVDTEVLDCSEVLNKNEEIIELNEANFNSGLNNKNKQINTIINNLDKKNVLDLLQQQQQKSKLISTTLIPKKNLIDNNNLLVQVESHEMDTSSSSSSSSSTSSTTVGTITTIPSLIKSTTIKSSSTSSSPSIINKDNNNKNKTLKVEPLKINLNREPIKTIIKLPQQHQQQLQKDLLLQTKKIIIKPIVRTPIPTSVAATIQETATSTDEQQQPQQHNIIPKIKIKSILNSDSNDINYLLNNDIDIEDTIISTKIPSSTTTKNTVPVTKLLQHQILNTTIKQQQSSQLQQPTTNILATTLTSPSKLSIINRTTNLNNLLAQQKSQTTATITTTTTVTGTTILSTATVSSITSGVNNNTSDVIPKIKIKFDNQNCINSSIFSTPPTTTTSSNTSGSSSSSSSSSSSCGSSNNSSINYNWETEFNDVTQKMSIKKTQQPPLLLPPPPASSDDFCNNSKFTIVTNKTDKISLSQQQQPAIPKLTIKTTSIPSITSDPQNTMPISTVGLINQLSKTATLSSSPPTISKLKIKPIVKPIGTIDTNILQSQKFTNKSNEQQQQTSSSVIIDNCLSSSLSPKSTSSPPTTNIVETTIPKLIVKMKKDQFLVDHHHSQQQQHTTTTNTITGSTITTTMTTSRTLSPSTKFLSSSLNWNKNDNITLTSKTIITEPIIPKMLIRSIKTTDDQPIVIPKVTIKSIINNHNLMDYDGNQCSSGSGNSGNGNNLTNSDILVVSPKVTLKPIPKPIDTSQPLEVVTNLNILEKGQDSPRIVLKINKTVQSNCVNPIIQSQQQQETTDELIINNKQKQQQKQNLLMTTSSGGGVVGSSSGNVNELKRNSSKISTDKNNFKLNENNKKIKLIQQKEENDVNIILSSSSSSSSSSLASSSSSSSSSSGDSNSSRESSASSSPKQQQLHKKHKKNNVLDDDDDDNIDDDDDDDDDDCLISPTKTKLEETKTNLTNILTNLHKSKKQINVLPTTLQSPPISTTTTTTGAPLLTTATGTISNEMLNKTNDLNSYKQQKQKDKHLVSDGIVDLCDINIDDDDDNNTANNAAIAANIDDDDDVILIEEDDEQDPLNIDINKQQQKHQQQHKNYHLKNQLIDISSQKNIDNLTTNLTIPITPIKRGRGRPRKIPLSIRTPTTKAIIPPLIPINDENGIINICNDEQNNRLIINERKEEKIKKNREKKEEKIISAKRKLETDDNNKMMMTMIVDDNNVKNHDNIVNIDDDDDDVIEVIPTSTTTTTETETTTSTSATTTTDVKEIKPRFIRNPNDEDTSPTFHPTYRTPRGRGRGLRGTRRGRGSRGPRGINRHGHFMGNISSDNNKINDGGVIWSTPESKISSINRKKLAQSRITSTPVLQAFEEDTRMSGDLSQNPTVARSLELWSNEESQNSFMSSGSTTIEGEKKKHRGRMEVGDAEGKTDFTIDMIAEYEWPPPTNDMNTIKGRDMYMLQEQIAEYLGVKSFKRKYPDLLRRSVEMEERNYLMEKGLVSEKMCDLGLTAVMAADILDIMFQDFHDKYEEYRKYYREKQTRDFSQKQKQLKMEPVDKSQLARDKSLQSASEWNISFNKERKDNRVACMDLQNLIVQLPDSRRQKMLRPINNTTDYPIALVPGQFSEYYKEYSPRELFCYPINTVLLNPTSLNERVLLPIKKLNNMSDDDSQSGDSSGDSSNSSSSDTDSLSDGSDGSDDSNSSDSSSSDDDDDEAAAAATKNRAAADSIKCRVCDKSQNSNRDNKPECFVQCSTCRRKAHPSCIEMSPRMSKRASEYSWQCTECKQCCKCHRSTDEDKMLFCDQCDRGYHIYCIGLRMVPQGRWHCTLCSICTSCGTRNPEGHQTITSNIKQQVAIVQWTHLYQYNHITKLREHSAMLCMPCAKLKNESEQ